MMTLKERLRWLFGGKWPNGHDVLSQDALKDFVETIRSHVAGFRNEVNALEYDVDSQIQDLKSEIESLKKVVKAQECEIRRLSEGSGS